MLYLSIRDVLKRRFFDATLGWGEKVNWKPEWAHMAFPTRTISVLTTNETYDSPTSSTYFLVQNTAITTKQELLFLTRVRGKKNKKEKEKKEQESKTKQNKTRKKNKTNRSNL